MIIVVFVASLLGNLLAYWIVFKNWRFPKIVVIPVSDKDPWLERFRKAGKGVGLWKTKK